MLICEQRCIVKNGDERILFIWGEFNDEMLGLICYVIEPPRQLTLNEASEPQ